MTATIKKHGWGNNDATNVDAANTLARLVVETSFQDLTSTAIEAVRLDVLDTLGCAIAGRGALGMAEANKVLGDTGGASVAGIWGTGKKLPATSAAFINAAAGHALDFDDKHPAITHTGVTTIPPALAAAEAAGVSTMEELLTAIVLGIEVADRMAHAVLDGPGVTGWLLTPLVGYFGAAAAAAKLYGINEVGVQNALGFAYIQASGNGQSTLDGALGKRLQAGFAARGGVFAAELAAAGLTGPSNSLEGERGFYRVYHRNRYIPDVLRRSTRDMWLVEEATFKPFPCCGWTHAALECAQLAASDGITEKQIHSVTIGVNAQAYASVGSPLSRRYQPVTPVDAQFSIPYTFSTAFTTGNVTLEDFTDEALQEPRRLELASKVLVEVDPEIEEKWGRGVSPARATIQLVDGRQIEKFVEVPLGELSRPMDKHALRTKFRTCTDYAGMNPALSDEIAILILEGTGPGSVGELSAALNRAV